MKARKKHRSAIQLWQRVWLTTQDLLLQVESRKLVPKFTGPFNVLKKVNPVLSTLQLPKTLEVNLIFHIPKLKPLGTSPLAQLPHRFVDEE